MLLQRVASRWRLKEAASAFGAWVAFCQSQRQHRHVGAKIMRRMLNRALWHAFGQWLEALRVGRYQRGVLQKSVNRIQYRTLAKAFLSLVTSWRNAQQRCQMMGKMRRVVLRISHRALARAVASWLFASRTLRHQRWLLRKTAVRWRCCRPPQPR